MVSARQDQFLDYLFWYYLIAHHATRGKSVSTAELLGSDTVQFLYGLRSAPINERVEVEDKTKRVIAHYHDDPPLLNFAARYDDLLVNIRPGFRPTKLFRGPHARGGAAKPFWDFTTRMVTEKTGLEILRRWSRDDAITLDELDLLPADLLSRDVVEGERLSELVATTGVKLAFRGAVIGAVYKARVWIGLRDLALAQRLAGVAAEDRAIALGADDVLLGEHRRAAVKPRTADVPRKIANQQPLLAEIQQQEVHDFDWPTPPTDDFIASNAATVIRYLARGKPEDPGRADSIIDGIRNRMLDSTTGARAHQCRTADRESMYLSHRLTHGPVADWSIWYRRYFAANGDIDVARAQRAAQLYEQLNHARNDRADLPRFEFTARTATGIVSATVGECLRDRYATTPPPQHRSTREKLRERVANLAQRTATAISETALPVHARALDYAAGLTAAFETFRQARAMKWAPVASARARHDVLRITDALLGTPLLPYVDAGARHVWILERQIMFADFDDATTTLVHPAHIPATVFCAPEWHLPVPDEYCSGTPALAAMYWLLQEIIAATRAHHQHQLCPATRRDLAGLLVNLRQVTANLRAGWPFAAAVHDLNEERLHAARARVQGD